MLPKQRVCEAVSVDRGPNFKWGWHKQGVEQVGPWNPAGHVYWQLRPL